MGRKTNIYTQLHNANIGEYVTDSIDIFDSYSNLSQYDFNKSIRGMIASSSFGSSNLKLIITPSSFYVKSSLGCTLNCRVEYNGEDYTDVVVTWEITRISVDKQDDEDWKDIKNNGEKLTNNIVINAEDLNGDAALFTVKAIITTDMQCESTISLMSYSASGSFIFDLDNQIDFVATDSMMVVQWNQEIYTRGVLSFGATTVIPDSIEFEYNGLPEGCASYNSLEEMDITVTLMAGQKVSYNNALVITASGVYQGQEYHKSTIFTIKADTDGVTHNVAPSRDKIHLSSTGLYTPTTMSCGIRRQTISGITYPTEVPKGLRLTMVIDDGPEIEITPEDKLYLFGDNMTKVYDGIMYTLYENGAMLDCEWVPVLSDGVTGESTIRLDLDNEMDAIPVDGNYITLEDTVITSNATMYYGYEEMTFVRNVTTKLTIETPDEEDQLFLKNIKSELSYRNSNKLLCITVSCEAGVQIPKKLNITLTAVGSYGQPGTDDYRSKALKAALSIIPMIVSDETPLYYLIPSANSIKVNKSNARQPINIGVTTKKRTGTTGYITTDYGYVRYKIDDEKFRDYVRPLDTEEIAEQILFEYYDENDELLDRETVPVIFDGKDGAGGRSIKDMNEYYIATATKDEIPSYEANWIKNEMPDDTLFNEDFPFLWNYEETIYINYGEDASIWRSTPSLLTHYVKGIKSIDEYYLAVPENSGIDCSYVKAQDIFLTKNGKYEWLKFVIPEMSDISCYLWNFERINFDTGTFTTTDPGIIGVHGESNFFMDIDNQTDYISCDQWGYVVPSNVQNTDILKYGEYDKFGHLTKTLKASEIIFEDNSTNIGTVIISSSFTVYYGNTKANVKGLGFQFSDPMNFKASAYGLPNTVYPIIIEETEDGTLIESEPDVKGSWYNPYTVLEALTDARNTRGRGRANADTVERGDVYVSGVIIGYYTKGGYSYIGLPGNDILEEDIAGIVLYHKKYVTGEDVNTSERMLVQFTEDYTSTKIYNPNPKLDEGETWGINLKSNPEYFNADINICGFIQSGLMTATSYAEIYVETKEGKNEVLNTVVFGAFDLSSVKFYVFVKPEALIEKINWVTIVVDIEAFGRVHRVYSVLSLYSVRPGEDAMLYQLQSSHSQIQRRKNGQYVPSLYADITCHILKRRGNDFLENINFTDCKNRAGDYDVSMYFSFDSGDYTYIPFTEEEYYNIVDMKRRYNENPNDTIENDLGELVNIHDLYAAVWNIPSEFDTTTSYKKPDGTRVTYNISRADYGRKSLKYGEFPAWVLRDIFDSYLDPDGNFKKDEQGNIIHCFNQLSFKLVAAKTGEQIDLLLIPVVYDGEETIIADLTNEMDAVAMNEINYTIADSELHTTFTVRSGNQNLKLKDRLVSYGQIPYANLTLWIDDDTEVPLWKENGRIRDEEAVNKWIYWSFIHDAATNEYHITIYVAEGAGDEFVNDRVIIEVRGVLEQVSAAIDADKMEITRSCIFTIHGVPCGENGKIYQIQPTYNNIKINDIGEYMPDTIDCIVTYRYGVGDPQVMHFNGAEEGNLYKDFLLGPRERGEHDLGRDALVIGYTVDNENNLNSNGLLPAHWWVHKGYKDNYILADDDNDTNFFPFVEGNLTPDNYNFFDKIEYPSFPSFMIAEQITFFLYQRTIVYGPNGEENYTYTLLDKESVPVVEGAHEVHQNLVSGTATGEKWRSSGAVSMAEHDFRLRQISGTRRWSTCPSLQSPEFKMQTAKEFIVSLECRLIHEDPVTGESIMNEEDIETMLYPGGMTDEDPTNEELANNNAGIYAISLEFFDGSTRLAYKGTDEFRNTTLITNYGNSDKSRYKEWTRLKFKPYQADDIVEETEVANFKLTYTCPNDSDYILQIRHIKCEYGDVATEWCLSEYDKMGSSAVGVWEWYYATDDIGVSPKFWSNDNIKGFLADLESMDPSDFRKRVDLTYYPNLTNKNIFYTWYSHNSSIGNYFGSEAGYNMDFPYLWNVEIVTDLHENILTISDPALISIAGLKVVNIEEYYLATDKGSGVTVEYGDGNPGNPWIKAESDNINPDGSPFTFGLSDSSNYLWNYEKVYYTQGETSQTQPCIVSVFNSNLRVDLDNELDAIPVDHESYRISSTKNIQVKTTVNFFYGTTKAKIIGISASIQNIQQCVDDWIITNGGEMDWYKLVDMTALGINAKYIGTLLLTARDNQNKAVIVSGSDDEALIQQWTEDNDIDSLISYLNEKIPVAYFIELMIQNVLRVQVNYNGRNSNILLNIANPADAPTTLNMPESDMEDCEIILTAYAPTESATVADRKFPKIIDQYIPITLTVTADHNGRVFTHSAVFTLMLFEGDGVYQLLPSCSAIKETSLGIQYATTNYPDVRYYDKNGNLYNPAVDPSTELENIDFVTCRIIYRKGGEDTSLYNDYTDISTYLILEVADDGGAYLPPTTKGWVNSKIYPGTAYGSIKTKTETEMDPETFTEFSYIHPVTDDVAEDPSNADFIGTYVTGTGYYPRIPLYTLKVVDDLIANELPKSNYFISNALTFRLKVVSVNSSGKKVETIVDYETIPVIKDGADGLDGASQARNYIDGTDDGTEYKRVMSIDNITDSFYNYIEVIPEDTWLVPYRVYAPFHMDIAPSIKTGMIKQLVDNPDRNYVRFSGIFETKYRTSKPIYLSWGKPKLIATAMIIVYDGKDCIKNGTYFSSIELFDCLEDQAYSSQLFRALNTTQNILAFDTVSINHYRMSDEQNAEKFYNSNLGDILFYSGLQRIYIDILSTIGQGVNLKRAEGLLFIDFGAVDAFIHDDEGNIKPFRIGAKLDSAEPIINCKIRYFVTPAGTYSTSGTQFAEDTYPNITLEVRNKTNKRNKQVIEVIDMDVNKLLQMTTDRNNPTDTSIIILDSLVSLDSKYYENSEVLVSTFMLGDIDVYYHSFKMETEYDAPRYATTWTPSDNDRMRPTNYNILFGSETGYYENEMYWKVDSTNITQQNFISIVDENDKGVLKIISTAFLDTSVRNKNIITPNQSTYYTLTFEAMYESAINDDPSAYDGEFDVYLMYDFQPPFDDINDNQSATSTTDSSRNTIQWNYTVNNTTYGSLSVERNVVFDAMTGTYVLAHQRYNLAKNNYNRYVLFTPHQREISDMYYPEFSFIYNFHIAVYNPGSTDGRAVTIYLKNLKLEKGLFPTQYDVNLDEFKGVSYDLIPYFETVEVRTNKAMDLTEFDVTIPHEELDSVVTVEDQDGNKTNYNLSEFDIYTIDEDHDDDNVMTWFNLYKEYTEILDDTVIAYISSGIAPNTVEDPILSYITDLIIECATPYAHLYYYVEYLIYYQQFEGEGELEDMEAIIINNGRIYNANNRPILPRECTVYAIGTRDLYNNSNVVILELRVEDNLPPIHNIPGTYNGYLWENSLHINYATPTGNTNNIPNGIMNTAQYHYIFPDSYQKQLQGRTINTITFTLASGSVLATSQIKLQKYTKNGNSYMLVPPDVDDDGNVKNNNYIIITITDVETYDKHMTKYFENFPIGGNEYIGLAQVSYGTQLETKTVGDASLYRCTLNTNSSYLSLTTLSNITPNIDLGYTLPL